MSTTPNNGDPTCSISTCSRIIAQVDCILHLLQGTTGCINIQFFGKDNLPLDLTRFSQIQILLYDELECGLVNFWSPSVPAGKKGFLLTILQSGTTNKGLLKVCLSSACSSTSPGNLFAEIRLTEVVGGNDEIYGISCMQVAKILPSKIYDNLDTSCS